MADQNARAVEEAEVRAVITRCGCGTPAAHPGAPCPQGVQVPLGTIAYWHRNPVRRALWSLTQKFTRHSTR